MVDVRLRGHNTSRVFLSPRDFCFCMGIIDYYCINTYSWVGTVMRFAPDFYYTNSSVYLGSSWSFFERRGAFEGSSFGCVSFVVVVPVGCLRPKVLSDAWCKFGYGTIQVGYTLLSLPIFWDGNHNAHSICFVSQ